MIYGKKKNRNAAKSITNRLYNNEFKSVLKRETARFQFL